MRHRYLHHGSGNHFRDTTFNLQPFLSHNNTATATPHVILEILEFWVGYRERIRSNCRTYACQYRIEGLRASVMKCCFIGRNSISQSINQIKNTLTSISKRYSLHVGTHSEDFQQILGHRNNAHISKQDTMSFLGPGHRFQVYSCMFLVRVKA